MLYLGSGDCDVPVLAITLGLCALVVLLLAAWALARRRRAYQKEQARLHKAVLAQRALIQAHLNDIKLMSDATLIDWEEIELLPPMLAKGAFGEVLVRALAPHCAHDTAHRSRTRTTHARAWDLG